MRQSPSSQAGRFSSAPSTPLPRSGFVQLALQLRSRVISESLAHHDSWIMDDGWVGRGDAGAVGVVVAGREGADRAAAHVPHEMTFATKPRLARAMIERAIAAGVPFGWVAGDTIYGVGAH